MQDIQRHNCAGLCQHQFCSSPYTKFCNLTINSMPLHLAFCDRHSEEFESEGWQPFIEGNDRYDKAVVLDG